VDIFFDVLVTLLAYPQLQEVHIALRASHIPNDGFAVGNCGADQGASLAFGGAGHSHTAYQTLEN
jgi:hypothetical protein